MLRIEAVKLSLVADILLIACAYTFPFKTKKKCEACARRTAYKHHVVQVIASDMATAGTAKKVTDRNIPICVPQRGNTTLGLHFL